MADQDKMSPDASPGVANKTGVRRVNKKTHVHCYRLCGCISRLVVAYVANKRATRASDTAETIVQRGSSRDTSAMAMDVMEVVVRAY
ncbi:hypothetical protein [Escherichia coli]|uniref:hypothetical protein n=1 Tax=Escherichia coli TaxID=562 RepID=UPI003890014D